MKTEALPADLVTERLVLGALIRYGEMMDSLRGTIDPDDFWFNNHKLLWSAMCGVYDAGITVGVVEIYAELKNRNIEVASGKWGVGGALEDMTEMTSGVYEDINLEHSVNRLKDQATKRRIATVADSFVHRCLSGAESADELRQAFAASSLDLLESSSKRRGPISSRELIEHDGIDVLLAPQKDTGIRFPWERLQNIVCGMREGQMIVLAAKTGHGKTSMALQIATHAARQGFLPFYWAMEATEQELFRVAVNQLAGVDSYRMKHGTLTAEERERQRDAVGFLHGHPFYYDTTSNTVPAFCANLRQAIAKSAIGLVVVDNLQHITLSGRAESRTRTVGESSRALKRAAMQFRLPFLVLSQFRRLRDDEELDIGALKESGDIENDSDVVLLLDSPKFSEEPTVTVSLKIGKQRSGPSGNYIPLRFHRRSQAFESIEGEKA